LHDGVILNGRLYGNRWRASADMGVTITSWRVEMAAIARTARIAQPSLRRVRDYAHVASAEGNIDLPTGSGGPPCSKWDRMGSMSWIASDVDHYRENIKAVGGR